MTRHNKVGDQDKGKEQLVAELAEMRQQVADMQARLRLLEAAEAAHWDTETQLQRRVREMTALNRITNLTTLAKDMAEALHHVCAVLARFLRVSQAGFAILDSEQAAAEVVADYHPPGSPSAIGVVIPVQGNPSMAYILEHQAPLVVAEAQSDPLLAPIHDVMRQRNVQSILIAPILVEGRVIGTLGFDAFERRLFSQADVELVQHVSNQVGPLLMWKQAQEALWESEARYRILFEQANDAIHLENEKDEIIDANQRACEMMGYSREELLSMRVSDLQASGVRKEAGSIIKGELTRYGNATFEALNVHRDGTLVPVEVSVARVEGLKGDVYISIVRDISERVRARRALWESEERYRMTIDAMDDAVHVVDRDLRFILFNEALLKLSAEFGIEGDPSGQKVFDYFPFLPDKVHAEYEYVLETGQPLVAEEEIKIGSRTVWTETRKIPTLDQEGQTWRIITMIRDVSERKEAEQALKLTQFSIDRAGDAALWMDAEGNLFYVNDAACRSLGYSRQELLSMTIHDIAPDFPPEDWPEHWRRVKQRNSFTLESRHRTKSGKIFPVEVRINYLAFGGKEYDCAFARDITKRKQANEVLRQRNRKLFLLNQVGQELVTTLDQFKITEQLLQVVTEIVGSQESSVWLWEKEQPSQPLLQENPDQSWLVCRAASPHAQGGSPLNLRLRPNQGVVGWVAQNEESAIVSNASDDARFFPGIDEQSGFHTRSLLAVPLRVRGRVIGALEAVNKLEGEFDETDITLLETLAASAAIAIDNADLVETLRTRTIELQERNEDLDAYAHTVAHDLKGPLAHMIGFAQVLEQSFAELPAEALRRHLRTISQSGRKMNNIIDELLLLARLREAEVRSIPLDMDGIVDEVLARLAYMIEGHQAEIILPESWPLALGYGPWVEEIWVNYLSNALMYGGRPPRVELGVDDSGEWGVGSGEDTLTDDHQQPTTRIRFWVRDNGLGLTPEEQARLFKSFERLDRVRAKGYGLGLSIVRRIAEKLGGEVGVASAPGQGSVFWFTLPGA